MDVGVAVDAEGGLQGLMAGAAFLVDGGRGGMEGRAALTVGAEV